MNKEMEQISAKTLIEIVFELIELEPDSNQWNEDAQQDNLPRLIRLQQIAVLYNLFMNDLGETIPFNEKVLTIINGGFIAKRPKEKYMNAFEEMEQYLHNKNHEKQTEWMITHLKHNYEKLIEFRGLLFNAQRFNEGLIDVSYPYYYSVLLSDEIGQGINTKTIDEYLSMIIDPEKRIWDKQFMVEHYNYPKEDRAAIDAEWL